MIDGSGRAAQTIAEDDAVGVTVTPAALTVLEGQSRRYLVALDSQPTADVTVTPALPEAAELSVAPAALTFAPSTWRTQQVVAVTAQRDDDALDDDAVTLTHALGGAAEYRAVTAPRVTVTVQRT